MPSEENLPSFQFYFAPQASLPSFSCSPRVLHISLTQADTRTSYLRLDFCRSLDSSVCRLASSPSPLFGEDGGLLSRTAGRYPNDSELKGL